MAENNDILLEKAGVDYWKVLRREAADETKEAHFRSDDRGEHWINGKRCRPANISGTPDNPGPWRSLYGDTIEEIARKYEEDGWVRVQLDSFTGPGTERPQ